MNRIVSVYSSVFKEKSRTSNLIRQAFYTFLLKGVSVLISFLYVPLLLNYLSKEKYGIWLTLITITNWVGLFDIGLGNGLRNKLAEALAMNDMRLARIYVSTTYALFGIITIIFVIFFNLVNLYIPWNNILNSSLISPNELLLLTSMIFSFTILRFFSQLIGVIFIAHQRTSTNDLIITISSLISLLCVYLISLHVLPGNIILPALVITLTPAVMYMVFSIVAFSSIFKYIRPSLKHVKFSYSRPLFLLSMRFFAVQITALVTYASANVLVANLFNPQEVIVYNIAFTIFNACIMVMTLCVSPIWSSVTQAYYSEDFYYLKRTLRRLNMLSVVFSIGVLVLLAISNNIYQIWLKGKVTIPFHLSTAMAIYAIVFMFQAPYSAYVNGMGKIKLTSSLSFFGIVVYLLGAILLSKYLNSSDGVIIGITISSIIWLFIQRFQVNKLLSNSATGIWNA